LITARTEWYEHPAALPTVRFGTVELDLRRRDFTINAMAIPVGEYGTRVLADAQGDLSKKIIRALHPFSFRDDPTRMYRAVRYERRLLGQIHVQTLDWMSESLQYVALVAGERLRHELNWAFLEDEPHFLLNRMEELGLLAAIVAGLHWHTDYSDELQAVFAAANDPAWQLSATIGNLALKQMLGYGVWFHALDEGLLRTVLKRLTFSIHQSAQFLLLNQVCRCAEVLKNAKNSQWAQELDGLSNEMLLVLDCLWREKFPAAHEKILACRDQWKAMKPFHTGNDLQSLGIAPGPVYASLLRYLREARIDNAAATVEQERELLLQWLHENGISFNG